MNQAARIAMDLRAVSPQATGVGRTVFCLAKALLETAPGRQFFLLTDKPGNLEGLAGAPNAEVVRVPYAVTQHPRGDIWLNSRLRPLLQRLGALVYHGPAFIVPFRDPGVPVVQTIHDLSLFRSHAWSPVRFRHYMRWMIRLGVRRAARIAVPSEAVRADLLARFRLAPERVEVVPWASTTDDRPPSPEAVSAYRERMGLPERYVLAIGALEQRKNPLALAHALASIPLAERPTLVWAGADGYRGDSLNADMAGGLGAGIRRIPRIGDPDLDLLRAGAAAVVVPSWHEGFSLPVLEAMAHDVPVVCSDIPAHHELAGEAALFAQPGDATAFRDAILRLLNDPPLAARLAHAGALRAAGFSWRATAERMLAVLDGAAAAPGA